MPLPYRAASYVSETVIGEIGKFAINFSKNICNFCIYVVYCMGVNRYNSKMQNNRRKWHACNN